MSDEQDEAARARALILQRRNRFIAAAIAGLGAANSACSDTHSANNPPAGQQDGGAGNGGTGLGGAGAVGGGPRVCLSIPIAGSSGFGGAGTGGFGGAGTGGFGGAGTGGGGGAGRGGNGGAGSGGSAGRPQVCLEPPIDDCPNGRPPPCVCLTAPIDEDAGID